MGKLLLSLPCQKALPSAGWLERPKALVAPRQAVAERSLEGISDHTAAHRVQAGRAGLTDTLASGRESPFMKAGCGKTAGKLHVQFVRRTEASARAIERASSDPTVRRRTKGRIRQPRSRFDLFDGREAAA